MGADSARSNLLDVAVNEYVDNIEQLLRAHEENEHEGKRCDDERGNVIAYVIHRMGYGPATRASLLEHLAFYQTQHDEAHGKEKEHDA